MIGLAPPLAYVYYKHFEQCITLFKVQHRKCLLFLQDFCKNIHLFSKFIKNIHFNIECKVLYNFPFKSIPNSHLHILKRYSNLYSNLNETWSNSKHLSFRAGAIYGRQNLIFIISITFSIIFWFSLISCCPNSKMFLQHTHTHNKNCVWCNVIGLDLLL